MKDEIIETMSPNEIEVNGETIYFMRGFSVVEVTKAQLVLKCLKTNNITVYDLEIHQS